MKIKKISPLEHNFTKRLDGIAVMPKMLYYYGELPTAESSDCVFNPSEAASVRPVFTGGRRYCSLASSAMPPENQKSQPDDSSAMAGACIPVFQEANASGLHNTTENTSDNPAIGSVMPQKQNIGTPAHLATQKSVAIVGARRNTPYGEDVAFRAAYELAKRGVVIVSGLALGIDSIAHRGALAADGKTVAVFGTPINEIHPQCHSGLAREILAKGGALISEYPVGAKLNYKRSFLERNRLISGLADAVIVVEANVRSGSLNTATHALEQGRELFAVPGDINRPLSQGCNRLIMQGANPYTCVEDVLNFLFPEAEKKKNRKQLSLFGDNPDETALLRALSKGISSGEEILRETGMGAAKYNQTVTMLEIKGRIRSLGMNRWTLR